MMFDGQEVTKSGKTLGRLKTIATGSAEPKARTFKDQALVVSVGYHIVFKHCMCNVETSSFPHYLLTHLPCLRRLCYSVITV